MPQITIEIDEQQAVAILNAIQKRRDFRIDGGQVFDGEKNVFLRGITFQFYESEHSARVEKQLISG